VAIAEAEQIEQIVSISDAKRRYEVQTIATASPEVNVVMLYNRLVDDINCALAMFDVPDFKPVFDLLIHAQQIIHLLSASLRVDIWPAGANLVALYAWMGKRLSHAAMFQERAAAQECLPIIARLADAWRLAAEKVQMSRSDTSSGYDTGGAPEIRKQIADFLA